MMFNTMPEALWSMEYLSACKSAGNVKTDLQGETHIQAFNTETGRKRLSLQGSKRDLIERLVKSV